MAVKKILPSEQLNATGTPDNTHALFGDNTWKTIAGGGGSPSTDEYFIGNNDLATLPNAVWLPDEFRRAQFVDQPPTSAGSLDDEFNAADGTAINAGVWTWVNQGGATAIQQKGFLQLTSDTTNGNNNRLVVQAAPATPWEVTVKLSYNCYPFGSMVGGLCMRDSGTGKILVFAFEPAVSRMEILNYNSATSFSGGSNQTGGGGMPFVHYSRIKDDGTNHIFSISMDGITFQTFLTQSRTTFLATPNQVGLLVDSNNNSTRALTMSCPWFRRTL